MATGGGGSRPISLSSEPFYDFPCSNCAKDNTLTEGERFCVECNETFCSSCLVFHNKIAAMRQHDMVDMLSRKSQLEAVQLPVTQPTKDSVQLPTTECIVHSGQIINMYCGQDDVVCCTVCIAENHRNCIGVVYIPKMTEKVKTSQDYKDVNTAIDDIRADIEQLKKCKKIELEKLSSEHLQSQASIENIRVQINKHLDDLEASLREELQSEFKFHAERINKTIAKLELQLLEIEKSGVKLKNAENESQLFVDMKEVKMKNKKMRYILENTDKYFPKPSICFVPNQEISKILKVNPFGVLWEFFYGDFNIKTQDDQSNCNITGSCQMLDGTIAITDIDNEKLKLLDRSCKVIAECELPGCPRNVCRTSPTEVAISMIGNKTVLFAEIADKISLKGSFSVGEACRGIAYNKGLLYVTCGGYKNLNEGPGNVKVFDMAGKLINTFMKDSKRKKNLFSLPLDIVVSECETKLHIADRDNGIVTMNLDGTGLLKFKHPDMKFPSGMLAVNNGDLIVCGFYSHNVILFDKKGQKQAVLLSEKDGIENPGSVLYDRLTSRLIVSMWKSNHIKVHTPL